MAIKLLLPPNSAVVGELNDTLEPGYLCTDLLSVEVPSGVVVDVSWYPEFDPAGEYFVSVFHRTPEDMLFRQSTKSLSEVVKLVQDYAWMHGR